MLLKQFLLDITELPAVIDMKAAVVANAPKVHDDLAKQFYVMIGVFVEENKAANG